MKYHFKIHREGGGFWAECVELTGCVTQANTEQELQENMEEALNLYLDEPPDSRAVFSLPRKLRKTKNIVEVPVAPRVAFAFCMRRIRLVHKLTQSQAATRIGFTGSLTKYQRLERSKTANPELETIVRIKKAFPELPLDELTQL